jgi:hypothetical protein
MKEKQKEKIEEHLKSPSLHKPGFSVGMLTNLRLVCVQDMSGTLFPSHPSANYNTVNVQMAMLPKEDGAEKTLLQCVSVVILRSEGVYKNAEWCRETGASYGEPHIANPSLEESTNIVNFVHFHGNKDSYNLP